MNESKVILGMGVHPTKRVISKSSTNIQAFEVMLEEKVQGTSRMRTDFQFEKGIGWRERGGRKGKRGEGEVFFLFTKQQSIKIIKDACFACKGATK